MRHDDIIAAEKEREESAAALDSLEEALSLMGYKDASERVRFGQRGYSYSIGVYRKALKESELRMQGVQRAIKDLQDELYLVKNQTTIDM